MVNFLLYLMINLHVLTPGRIRAGWVAVPRRFAGQRQLTAFCSCSYQLANSAVLLEQNDEWLLELDPENETVG
jgi:hypothetical protein